MEKQTKLVFGSTMQALGTVVAAIGSTPSEKISEDIRNDLSLIGNVLQAVGNALLVNAGGEFLEDVGNSIQSTGNSIVVAGLIIDLEKDTKSRLEITGNFMQALGGSSALGGNLKEGPSLIGSYNIIANLLQVIGNSMQAVGGVYELKDHDKNTKELNPLRNSQTLEVSGSWIQAVGSVLSLIAQLKEVNESSNNGSSPMMESPPIKVISILYKI
jgi:hypothetical protein